jgi:hypothetical protein
LKVDQAGWGFEVFIKPLLVLWCPVWLHWRFMCQ